IAMRIAPDFQCFFRIHLIPGASRNLPDPIFHSKGISQPYSYAAVDIAVSISEWSIKIPGPIVELSVTFLKYLPFAVAGLAFDTALNSASAFSASCCAPKLTLPIGE